MHIADARDVLKDIRQRPVNAIGAGISRRDWHATETAYNHLRDKVDDLLRRLAQEEARQLSR